MRSRIAAILVAMVAMASGFLVSAMPASAAQASPPVVLPVVTIWTGCDMPSSPVPTGTITVLIDNGAGDRELPFVVALMTDAGEDTREVLVPRRAVSEVVFSGLWPGGYNLTVNSPAGVDVVEVETIATCLNDKKLKRVRPILSGIIFDPPVVAPDPPAGRALKKPSPANWG